MISIVVTTYGRDTLRTRICLDAILTWKRREHELIVVVHDESILLGTYLRTLYECGQIDKLILAGTRNGHVRGVNLGFDHAQGELLVNVNTDVMVGAGTVDRVTHMFNANKHLGLVGWHYNWAPEHTGSFWHGNRLQHTVRIRENLARRRGYVDARHMQNIRLAHWASGRVIRAVGDRRILCANTSFFAIRAGLWRSIGGFDEARYPHSWADDFLCYAVLDQGMDIANLPADIRCSQDPARFISLSDLAWEGKNDRNKLVDRIVGGEEQHPTGGWQRQFFALLKTRIESGARVTIAGDPRLVPHVLTQYCRSHRNPLIDDTDYLLVGGRVPKHALERIRPGGALLQFRTTATQIVAAPGPRVHHRISTRPRVYVATSGCA